MAEVNKRRRRLIKGIAAAASLALLAPHGRNKLRNGKIHILFQFSAHVTKEDAAQLDETMDAFKPHVICYENAGASTETADEFDRVLIDKQRGRASSTRYADYMAQLERVIRKHGVIPYGLERFEKVVAPPTDKDKDEAWARFTYGEPEKAIVAHRQYLLAHAQFQVKRENHIRARLERLQEELEERFPHLQKEPEIRVVVKYGTGHEGLHNRSSEMGFKAITVQKPTDTVYSLTEQYWNSATAGKAKELTDEKVGQIMLNNILAGQLREKIGLTTRDADLISNHLIQKTPGSAFRKISREFGKLPDNVPNPLQEFHSIIRRNGIPMPTTKEEAQAYKQKHSLH